MRPRLIQGSLSLSGGLLVVAAILLLGMRYPNPAATSPFKEKAAIPYAFVHEWDVNEIFSCGDGSEQFVELRNPTAANSEIFFNGETLVATNLAGTLSHTFTFTGNISPPTGNKTLLIATSGFSSLSGGVTPDFTLPDNFLFPEGGSVKFGTYDTVSYGAGTLPLNGVDSLNRQGATLVAGPNTPTNFAGQPGSVSCPAAPDLTLSKTAQASGIVEAGSVLTYTIVAANQGTAVATNTLITDAIPLSTTYVPNSASDGGIFGSGIITWDNLTISSGTTLTRTFQVTVGATITTGDRITNTAYISSAQGETAEDSVTVTAGQEISQKTYLPIILKNN